MLNETEQFANNLNDLMSDHYEGYYSSGVMVLNMWSAAADGRQLSPAAFPACSSL